VNRSEVIALATKLTENKIGSEIDAKALYTTVLQEFCAEARFWWRKIQFTFNTANGTATYDLGSVTTVPVITGLYIDEFTKVERVDSTTQVARLEPVFDDEEIASILEAAQSGQPASYFILPQDGKSQTMQFDVTPGGVYKIRVAGWAIPNPASDTTSDAISLIPAPYHRALVHGMEREVWRTVYGPQDSKMLSAEAKYQKVLSQALEKKEAFSPSKVRRFVTSDPSVVVQSTH
jgi:hypothetical protein